MTDDLEPLCIALRRLCTNRSLSAAANEERFRLLVAGDRRELEEVISHLRSTRTIPPEDLDPCPATSAVFDALWRETVARSTTHRGKIERTARRLAREVAADTTSRAEAIAQLGRLCHRQDEEVADLGSVHLVPWREGTELASAVFLATLVEAVGNRIVAWAS